MGSRDPNSIFDGTKQAHCAPEDVFGVPDVERTPSRLRDSTLSVAPHAKIVKHPIDTENPRPSPTGVALYLTLPAVLTDALNDHSIGPYSLGS